MHDNSTLKGVVLYYPQQNPDAEPQPYPYAIAMRGKNPAVLAVEMLNPYNGIDATRNERHLIRDVRANPCDGAFTSMGFMTLAALRTSTSIRGGA